MSSRYARDDALLCPNVKETPTPPMFRPYETFMLELVAAIDADRLALTLILSDSIGKLDNAHLSLDERLARTVGAHF